MESLTSIIFVGKFMYQVDQLFLTGMKAQPVSCSHSHMNYDQAMKVADSNKFRQAILEEIANHFA